MPARAGAVESAWVLGERASATPGGRGEVASVRGVRAGREDDALFGGVCVGVDDQPARPHIVSVLVPQICDNRVCTHCTRSPTVTPAPRLRLSATPPRGTHAHASVRTSRRHGATSSAGTHARTTSSPLSSTSSGGDGGGAVGSDGSDGLSTRGAGGVAGSAGRGAGASEAGGEMGRRRARQTWTTSRDPPSCRLSSSSPSAGMSPGGAACSVHVRIRRENADRMRRRTGRVVHQIAERAPGERGEGPARDVSSARAALVVVARERERACRDDAQLHGSRRLLPFLYLRLASRYGGRRGREGRRWRVGGGSFGGFGGFRGSARFGRDDELGVCTEKKGVGS